MELNAEQIKKALDWLDSLVGNSNDSDIALLTYQLLGILYDTCEELTEENERLRADKDYWKNRAKESESEYDQAVKRGYELGAVDYVKSFAERLKYTLCINNEENTEIFDYAYTLETIDQTAKEMLEGADDEQ